MEFTEFANSVNNTLADYMKRLNTQELYTQLALGLHEEVGEVISQIRRTIKGNYHQKEIDYEHLEEEMGDTLWYIAQISNQLPEIDIQQVVETSLGKIKYNSNNMENYTRNIRDTYKEDLPSNKNEKATYFSLELITKAGEVCKILGEYRIERKELNILKIKKKLGETLKSLASICDTYNIPLSNIAIANLKKANGRYDSNGISTQKENLELVNR